MFGIGKKKDKAEAPAAAPAAPAMSTVDMQPAGFWLRVVALFVDNAVLTILMAVMLIGGAGVGGEALVLPLYLLWLLITLLYWPVMESTAQRATVGKMAVGLVVADVDGGKLSFLRSLLRNLAKIISSIPFGIGFLLAAFTSRKQALHDLITKAVVLRRGPGSFVRAVGVLVLALVLTFGGMFMAADYISGAAMKELTALMGGEEPMSGKPPAMAKPAPKPAPPPPAPVAKPAAPPPPPPAPVAEAKPAAVPASAPAPVPVAKPAPVPETVAKPAPVPKPMPEKVAAAPAPKPQPAPVEEKKPIPAPEPFPVFTTVTQSSPGAAAAPPAASRPGTPGPKFNDVMTAVLYRDRAAVVELLDMGRWVDKRDSNGMTPLMSAAMMGDAAIAELLLERGADPDLQAPGGLTALDFALQNGEAATTHLLQRRRSR